MVTTFDFAFEPAYRLLSLPFGVRPSTAWVTVDEDLMAARFGPWRLSTGWPMSSMLGWPGRIGCCARPARRGCRWPIAVDVRDQLAPGRVCIRFVDPVPGIARAGGLRHPNLTVTVTDYAGLLAALDG